MTPIVRKLRSAVVIGLSWAVMWALIALTVGLLIQYFAPEQLGRGEEPYNLARIVGTVGVMCGMVFAAVLAFAERNTRLREISLWRAAFWGAIGGAALPLLTTMNDQIAFNTVPLGVISATVAVALARRAERRVSLDVSSAERKSERKPGPLKPTV